MNRSSEVRPTLLVYDYNSYEMMSQLISYEPLTLFVEEMIDYSLRQNAILNWVPPMNLEYLRLQHSGKRYFDHRIGNLISHACTERDAIDSAQKFGFDENSWLTLSPGDARDQLIGYFRLILMHSTLPMELAAFQMFSFGCYLARAAMRKQLNLMANEVVQALVRSCCVNFPYEKQYTECLAKVEKYNLENPCMHI